MALNEPVGFGRFEMLQTQCVQCLCLWIFCTVGYNGGDVVPIVPNLLWNLEEGPPEQIISLFADGAAPLVHRPP